MVSVDLSSILEFSKISHYDWVKLILPPNENAQNYALLSYSWHNLGWNRRIFRLNDLFLHLDSSISQKCPSSLHCHLRFTWFFLVPSKSFYLRQAYFYVCHPQVKMLFQLLDQLWRACFSVSLFNSIHPELPVPKTLCSPHREILFGFSEFSCCYHEPKIYDFLHPNWTEVFKLNSEFNDGFSSLS